MDALGIDRRPDGLALTDAVRAETVLVGLPTSATLTDVRADAGRLPVDRAVRVRTDRLTLEEGDAVWVREADLSLLDQFDFDAEATFQRDSYVLEVDGPLKAYVAVTASLAITTDDGRIEVRFGGPTTATVGGRARRQQPYETLRTTTDGADLLAPLGWLGAPPATESPERSWPTLRGHPPTVELAEAFEPPEGLALPETGLRLTLPPTPEYAFPAASLAAYLGARAEPADPGERPALRVADESTPLVTFPTGEGYADAVADLLRRTFLLDCIVRTEGMYPVDLSQRRRFEAALEGRGTTASATDADGTAHGATVFDSAALYDEPLAERVRAYLAVPDDAIEAVAPTWPVCAHVEPDPAHVTALPALVDELAAVHVGTPERVTGADARPVALEAFLGDPRPSGTGGDAVARPGAIDGPKNASEHPDPTDATLTRSAAEVFAEGASFALVPPADADNAVFVGEGIPVGADTFLGAGVAHRYAREPADGSVSVLLVANDPAMAPEVARVREVYGRDSSADLAVRTAEDVTRAELTDLLADGVDVLHFVGHATPEGLECVDGPLDVASLDSHDVDAFVLNACQSYRQGVRLVEDGAVAGAVALSDVENEDAIEVGLLLARLLNAGFPFRVAMRLARRLSVVGGQYTVVGDGRLTLAQPESRVPHVVAIRRADSGEYGVRLRFFQTPQCGLGSQFSPDIDGVDEQFITAGETPEFALDGDALASFLSREPVPVEYEGRLRWSTELPLVD